MFVALWKLVLCDTQTTMSSKAPHPLHPEICTPVPPMTAGRETKKKHENEELAPNSNESGDKSVTLVLLCFFPPLVF